MSFYTNKELENIGLKSFGKNVLISKKMSIYNPEKISIGNNVRIDDFCVFSPSKELRIGNYIHIGNFTTIKGLGKVIIEDFVAISGKVSIYSSSDDYSGLYMTGPMIPEKYRNVNNGDIIIKKHVVIGAGAVILPNVVLEEGVAVGSLSLIDKNCEEFYIYRGVPAVKISKRLRGVLNLEKMLIKN